LDFGQSLVIECFNEFEEKISLPFFFFCVLNQFPTKGSPEPVSYNKIWTVLGKFVEFEIDVSTGLPLNYLSHFFQHIQKIKDGHHFTKNINRIPLGKC
jgi:hypothetical protein